MKFFSKAVGYCGGTCGKFPWRWEEKRNVCVYFIITAAQDISSCSWSKLKSQAVISAFKPLQSLQVTCWHFQNQHYQQRIQTLLAPALSEMSSSIIPELSCLHASFFWKTILQLIPSSAQGHKGIQTFTAGFVSVAGKWEV